jgi:small subunit ribosomal protein S20
LQKQLFRANILYYIATLRKLMAITKSAKKAIRQSKTRNEQNVVYKNKIKELVKQARALVLAKKNDEAKKILPDIYAALDKAAKVGVIKKNNASRRKSRLTKLIDKKS